MSERVKVFVTRELSPFSAGGIGRVLHNVLRSMTDAERATSIVLGVDLDPDPAAFARLFPGAHFEPVSSGEADAERRADRPPRSAYADMPWLWTSARVLDTLERLARRFDIGYVEFPDWGGAGFATIQEKLVSGFLADATLAVRLHSAHAVLCAAEGYDFGDADRLLADIERKCCRDCDLLIVQNEPAALWMKRVYGFADAEWNPRVAVHAPPVLLDDGRPAARSVLPSAETPIVFGSKLQRIKGPELFVRGAAAFLAGAPAHRGAALLLAHDFDADYSAGVLDLIPEAVRDRFVRPGTRRGPRDAIIAASVSVIASRFESFCLAAYEASLLGAVVVLNGENPAFGDGTPWIDGVNCLKFDGTALGLAATLARAFALDRPLAVVEVPSGAAPWRRDATAARTPAPTAVPAPDGGAPLVSIVVPHRDLPGLLLDTIESGLAQSYPSIEVVVVDDGSREPDSIAMVDRIAAAALRHVRVVRLPGNVGLAAARNAGIGLARGRYVLPLDADDLIAPDFVARAVACLERDPRIDWVVPAARYFAGPSGAEPSASDGDPDHHVFVGEAFCSGFARNAFGTSCALFRRALFETFRYDETLDMLEDWGLYLQLVNHNRRCAVLNEALFYYRRRPGSMSRTLRDPAARARAMNRLHRTASSFALPLPLQFLALPGEARPEPGPDAVAAEKHFVEGHFRARSRMLGALVRRYREVRRLNDRRLLRELIEIFEFFDPDWYRATYADARGSRDDLLEQFFAHGIDQQRMPNPFFDPAAYLARHPDVRAAGVPAIVHFLLHGAGEGRTY